MDLAKQIKASSTQALISMQRIYGCQHYPRYEKAIFIKGDGVWLWDKDGKKYFDGNATYSTNAGGHRNEELIATLHSLLEEQCIPLTANVLMGPTHALLVRELALLTGLDKALIMNTGAEAVETSLKIARRWAEKAKGVPKDSVEIISFLNCFHGRTIAATATSSDPHYRDGFGAFPPGFIHSVPYDDIAALKRAITPNTGAILIEPIQCEGGMIIPTKRYFTQVRELCTERKILMIADEIQTGLGRTGKLFCCEWFGVKPDLILLGKALGQIIPVSAVVGIKEAMNILEPGQHGSTFGGTSISCGVALASLAQITQNEMAWVKNAETMGQYFRRELRKLQKKSPYIKTIRGRGLAIGIEINTNRISTKVLIEQLLEEGVVSGNAHNIALRVTPALNVCKEAIDWALPRFEKVLCPR